MVMIRLWWLVPKVNPRRSKRLPRIRFKLRALKKMSKLMQPQIDVRAGTSDELLLVIR
jgi:hypothetical protein